MAKRRVYREPVVQPLDKSIKLIPLTRGQVAIVNATDYDWLNQWNWCAWWCKDTRSFYARRLDFYMHSVIAGTSRTDHKNGNTLDNRRDNLRGANGSQNQANRKIGINNCSGYKGVSQADSGRWRSRIMVNRKEISLGRFDTPQQAAYAYNQAALKHFGEFARINHLHSADV